MVFTIVTSMSLPSSRTRGRPARLDRARTVQTALDLLNESGLDTLTMRRLAQAMDVQAGALYRYFAAKQDLLTAMAEHMVDGVADAAGATGDGDWSERTARLARALRAALLAHRDGARVFAGTHATGPNTLRFADGLVGVLREAGFGDGDAARALYSVANFTVGHTLEEQAALTPGAVGPSTRRPCARRWRQGPIPTSPQPCRCSPVRISRHTSSSGCGCSWTDCAPSGSDPGAPSGSLGAVSPPPAGRGRSVAACEAGSAGDRDESGAVTGHVRRRQSGRGDDDGGSGEDGGRAGLARRPAGGVLGARPPRRPPGRPGSGTDGGGQRLGPTIPEEHVPQPWLPGVRGQAVRSSGSGAARHRPGPPSRSGWPGRARAAWWPCR